MPEKVTDRWLLKPAALSSRPARYHLPATILKQLTKPMLAPERTRAMADKRIQVMSSLSVLPTQRGGKAAKGLAEGRQVGEQGRQQLRNCRRR